MNKIIQAQSQWDLDRLYPQEQNFTFYIETIERLKIEYKATKDSVILSQLIEAIEKAEYYLYCRAAEDEKHPENTY